ncbi:DUF2868 domain-containing protein [Desulforegula conservatrix]|uniref:DUF2868 domain-containing protein n=1 Tax=Desulforegula conservatrix TaxID=153026 RepID=UPI0003FF2D01|nr:DUF2868 domain-containing protein [Desulforegula conservatrix]
MNNGWTYKDIIDLEYAFFLDSRNSDLGPEDKEKRDRGIFIGLKSKGLVDDLSSDSSLVLEWARAITASYGFRKTPGTALLIIWKYFLAVMALAGFVAGASAVSAVLYYKGEAPVNVAIFLAITVLPHWIFLFILGLRFFFSLFSAEENRKCYPLLYLFISRAISWLTLGQGNNFRKNGGDSFDSWIIKLLKVYSSTFFWPILVLAQVFGLGAGIASLLVTFIKIAFTDLAFGWQSTLVTAPEKIHAVASFLAIPWKWLFHEGSGFPDLASVEGSRIILKDGILSLSTPDLASWWPFLCLCIIFYAVIPRLFLLLSGLWIANKKPDTLVFSHADCAHLVFRMRSPIFDTRAVEKSFEDDEPTAFDRIIEEKNEPVHQIAHEIVQKPVIEPVSESDSLSTPACNSLANISVAMVSGDFMDLGSEENIINEISRVTGHKVSRVITYDPEPDSEKKALGQLEEIISQLSSFSVSLIMEAWQPPIIETMDFVNMTRAVAGREKIMNIILTGKPNSSSYFTRPTDTDRIIWNAFIGKLADPYILLTEFGKYDA